jgi:hypothetical protein
VVDATILGGIAEVAGVWATTIAIYSGGAAAWALRWNRDVSKAAANGLAVGFLIGIPIAIAAAITIIFGE